MIHLLPKLSIFGSILSESNIFKSNFVSSVIKGQGGHMEKGSGFGFVSSKNKFIYV